MENAFAFYTDLARRLEEAGVPYAERDLGSIFEHVCGRNPCLDRSFAFSVTPIERDRIEKMVERRKTREPLAQIFGRTQFAGIEIKIVEGVFRPCLEAEGLIDHAVAFYKDKTPPRRILDLGTGTGCLLLALLRRFPEAGGWGVDRDETSVHAARENAVANGLDSRAVFCVGDWGEGLNERFDLIVGNPPAIPTEKIPLMPPELRTGNPLLSVDGGSDGLAFYKYMAAHFRGLAAAEGVGIFQVYSPEAEASLFRREGLQTEVKPNYLGFPSCLFVREGEKKRSLFFRRRERKGA